MKKEPNLNSYQEISERIILLRKSGSFVTFKINFLKGLDELIYKGENSDAWIYTIGAIMQEASKIPNNNYLISKTELPDILLASIRGIEFARLTFSSKILFAKSPDKIPGISETLEDLISQTKEKDWFNKEIPESLNFNYLFQLLQKIILIPPDTLNQIENSLRNTLDLLRFLSGIYNENLNDEKSGKSYNPYTFVLRNSFLEAMAWGFVIGTGIGLFIGLGFLSALGFGSGAAVVALILTALFYAAKKIFGCKKKKNGFMPPIEGDGPLGPIYLLRDFDLSNLNEVLTDDLKLDPNASLFSYLECILSFSVVGRLIDITRFSLIK